VYVPGFNQNWQQEKALFEQRIRQLDSSIVSLQEEEKGLIENNKLLTQSHRQLQQEKQWLEKENELLRQLVGLKQTA
jgi:predicted  nucleic acid-binding Zn-ribbon protein